MKIYLFDTYKVVCLNSVCSFTKNGIDIYDDDDHISSEWARDKLSFELETFIRKIQTMGK